MHHLQNVDELTARVFHALGRVTHLNRVLMTRTMAHRGIQPPEAFTLSLLARNDGVTQRELAEMLHLSHPRVSIILRNLERGGSIARRADEGDRRLVRVFLTAEGRQLEQEQREVLSAYVRGTIGALPEEERRHLERALNNLAERLVSVLHGKQEGNGTEEELHTR